LGTTTLGTASTLKFVEPNPTSTITYLFTATNCFDNNFDVSRIDGKFSFAANPDLVGGGELAINELIDFQVDFGGEILTQANADSFAISFVTERRSGINVPALQGIGRWNGLLFSFSKLRVDLPILSIGIGSLKNRHPFGFPDYDRIESPLIPVVTEVRGKVAQFRRETQDSSRLVRMQHSTLGNRS
jgi:hypothetical protein